MIIDATSSRAVLDAVQALSVYWFIKVGQSVCGRRLRSMLGHRQYLIDCCGGAGGGERQVSSGEAETMRWPDPVKR